MQATYAWLMAALVLSLLLGLPLREAGLGVWVALTLDTFSTVAAARATTTSRRERFWFVLPIFPSIAIGFRLAFLGGDDRWAIVGSLFLAGFLALTASRILRRLVKLERVTADSIIGSICVYLLIGYVFYYLYAALEMIRPGSFLEGGRRLLAPPRADRILSRRPELNYYSFETLTTLGFGDIVPAFSVARVLTVLEALTGQVFLATFIAFLLGTYISSRPGRLATRPPGPPSRVEVEVEVDARPAGRSDCPGQADSR